MNQALISDSYRQMNAELHSERASFGTSGKRWAEQIAVMAANMGTKDVLDYGCGKSTLSKVLPFAIKQYDPAIPEHAEAPKPADLVVCTDVLEHIEPALIDNVLDDLARVVKRKGFFTIALAPACKTLSDGRNAHLILESPRWWLDKLWDRFHIELFKIYPIGEMAVNVAPKNSFKISAPMEH